MIFFLFLVLQNRVTYLFYYYYELLSDFFVIFSPYLYNLFITFVLHRPVGFVFALLMFFFFQIFEEIFLISNHSINL